MTPVFTDTDALRAVAADADLIGRDHDGRAFLLVCVTEEVLDRLAAIDAVNEDNEPDHDGEDTHDAERPDYGEQR